MPLQNMENNQQTMYVNQHSTDVNQHPTVVNQHPTDVNQHSTDVNQHPTDVGQHSTDTQDITDKLQLRTLLNILLVLLLIISMPIMSQPVANKNEVVTEIILKSTPDKVWNMLTDFANYPNWHPFLKKIDGKPVKGTKIKVTYVKDDTHDGTFSAYILDCEPTRLLSWGGSAGFIFRAKHYFKIESIGNDSVKLTQGEYWRGIFGGMYGRKIYVDTGHKFELMNMKLKVILEK
jgi:hypothetical protein